MRFVKMNGAGNDFIILDNRDGAYDTAQLSALAKTVCHRHLSVGADGLMAIVNAEGDADFRMLFFNTDGSAGASAATAMSSVLRESVSASRPLRAL